MTKKHFRALAHAIRIHKPIKRGRGYNYTAMQFLWERMLNSVADVCAHSNPNFNREKFLTACREGL